MERVFVNIDRYGNTSAASVPIALVEAVSEGRIKQGDRIVLVAFGAGGTSGAIALQWTADPADRLRADAIGPDRRSPLSVPTSSPSTRSRRPSHGSWIASRRQRSQPQARPQHGHADVSAQAHRPGRRKLASTSKKESTMIDLTGKAALVTGGARGIGKAICLNLARQGADVAFVDMGRPEVAEATVAEIQALGRKALYIPADVTDPEACVKAVATVVEAFGKLDILVNNAGITRDDLIMRMPIDDWKKVLEVNLFGAFYMTKAAIRPMLKAHAGRIINMSSVSGQAGQMGQANYSSSKAGLIGLTKATAREVGLARHHLQRRSSRVHRDRADQGSAGVPDRPDQGQHAARAFRHGRGHRQRGHVPRVGRSRLHHRPGSRRRRRPGDAVGPLDPGGCSRQRLQTGSIWPWALISEVRVASRPTWGRGPSIRTRR